MIKESKEPRQNIRYLGFETTSDGGRRFDFSITAPGQNSVRVRLEIPGLAFTGQNRITYQESAKICYEKLRVLLESETGDATIPLPERIANITAVKIRCQTSGMYPEVGLVRRIDGASEEIIVHRSSYSSPVHSCHIRCLSLVAS